MFLLLMSVCVTSAAAQDEPVFENHYSLKKHKKKDGPKIKVDPALVRALNQRIADCYEAEQDKPLSAEDMGLLTQYGPEIANDLAAALSTTGCAVDQRASAQCVKMLGELECETLAAPIIAEGWDRNITPEARAQVNEYAGMLSRREARCEGRADEEAEIVQGVRNDRLAALIESQIVIGQCELSADKLPDCETQLSDATCQRLMELNEVGKLQQICTSVFHCIETPPPDEGPAR